MRVATKAARAAARERYAAEVFRRGGAAFFATLDGLVGGFDVA